MLRIYVADLAEYNAGILHGGWIDVVGLNADDILAEIKERNLVKANPCSDPSCPELNDWAIHDYEGFGDLIGEHTSFDTIAELSEVYENINDDDEWELYLEWAAHIGTAPGDVETVSNFHDAYGGTYRDLGEWAAEINEGCYDIPKPLQNYIDWDGVGRDAELNGDIFTIDQGGNVAVFWNH